MSPRPSGREHPDHAPISPLPSGEGLGEGVWRLKQPTNARHPLPNPPPRGGGGNSGECRRIAMWSGPRNLSTAMLRSFGNRADTAVSDEPFYGAFLKTSGADHPMREAVI